MGKWVGIDPKEEFHSPFIYVGNNPLAFIDPDGEGVFGAILSGSLAAASTYYQLKAKGISPTKAAFGALAAGSIAGLTSALIDPTDATTAITTGAISSGVSDVAVQLITTGKVDMGQVAKSSIAGGLTAGIMKGVGKGLFAKEVPNPYSKTLKHFEGGLLEAGEKTQDIISSGLGTFVGKKVSEGVSNSTVEVGEKEF